MKPRNIFPGEWESNFRGDGIEFAEIKPFEPGDDLRDLDLQALVQSGEEEVILRVVERQMRIYLWMDLSGSMRRYPQMFFSQKPVIRDIATGLILFSAFNTYNPVGLYAFNSESKKFFPARIGERQCWDMLGWIVEEEGMRYTAANDVQAALSVLADRALHQSLVFFVSDFEDQAFEENFTGLLRPFVDKFDFIPVVIQDPLEKIVCLKKSVRMTLQDSEGHRTKDIYLTPQLLLEIQQAAAKRLQWLKQNFQAVGIQPVILDSPFVEDCYRVLSGFFQARRSAIG
jgi:uncharacterized protein (DUF58 family)